MSVNPQGGSGSMRSANDEDAGVVYNSPMEKIDIGVRHSAIPRKVIGVEVSGYNSSSL